MTIWKLCQSCSSYCSTSKVPHSAIRRLKDKCLVKVESGKLRMHDVLRDMGTAIVRSESLRKPEEMTHLWDPSTAREVLRRKKELNRVRGMNLSFGKSNDTLNSVALKFPSMVELHLLVMDGCALVPSNFSSWPQELRWYQVRRFVGAGLPPELNLPKLVVLDLRKSEDLTHLWQKDAHIWLPFLQILILSECYRLMELPQNIGESLPRLKTLEMHYCWSIRVLPDSVGQMKQLEHLILSDCSQLAMLPDAIVDLTSLQRLVLTFCCTLEQLPHELGRLHNLEELDLSYCGGLKGLPPSLGGLKRLKLLDMRHTTFLDHQNDFAQWICLTSLRISRPRFTFESFGSRKVCDLGKRLASSLGAFRDLETLDMQNMATITVLPESLGGLNLLIFLRMDECCALLRIEGLPQGLQCLELRGCRKLIQVPSLAGMSSLMFLSFSSCYRLTHIQGLECLTTLEHIDLSNCVSNVDQGILGMHNKALRKCCLSGSRVGVAYNNKWLERKPVQQLLSYLDNAIGYLPNGMVGKVFHIPFKPEMQKVVEVTVSSKAKPAAVIICFKALLSGGGLKMDVTIQVMRDDMLVSKATEYSMEFVNGWDQVCLWTLRIEDPILQSLRFGDHIRVYTSCFMESGRISSGAICVVHVENEGAEDEHLILAVNSELLSRRKSKDLATKFGELILVDDLSQWLVARFTLYLWIEALEASTILSVV